MRRSRSAGRTSLLLAVSMAALAMFGGSSLTLAQTPEDPSQVVLVFDVSNSILQKDDGTNLEFAEALDGIADRVGVIADDLVAGNATVSFVAFARTALPYPSDCQQLELHDAPDVVARFEECLRVISADYAAGPNAAVKQQLNTLGTDYVAALEQAADLLPDATTRSAVVFFTDGKNDPPGTARDDEDVIAAVTPAFEGRSPLAILPVGLGQRAGQFESRLTALYDAFLRDMEPCAGRASFAWPEVAFPSGNEAGAAVALALQEVTCSFTVAPTNPPTAPPTPTPSEPPVITIPSVPGQPRAEPLDAAARLSVDPVAGETVDRYLFECTDAAGPAVQGSGPEPNVIVGGLTNRNTYTCVAYAENQAGRSAASVASASFTLCGSLVDCNPWLPVAIGGVSVVAVLAALLFLRRRSAQRARMWVTVQVDGGANRSLGWGQEHGVGLEQGPEGWFASSRPMSSAPIRIRYDGSNRFVVDSAAGIRNVHQGDPAPVRVGTDDDVHQLTVRLYRQRPKEASAKPTPRDDAGADALEARIDRGKGEEEIQDIKMIGDGGPTEDRPEA